MNKIVRCAPGVVRSYSTTLDRRSITFHPCGLTSHHPMDVRHLYCAACHSWLTPDQEQPMDQAPDFQEVLDAATRAHHEEFRRITGGPAWEALPPALVNRLKSAMCSALIVVADARRKEKAIEINDNAKAV